MVEKKRYHFDRNETKTSILEFILGNAGPVEEVAIREHLNEKYGDMDHGTINRHIHDLEKLNCVELVSPVKKSRSNFWDVKTQENLKEIRSNFEKIDLNQEEKALLIVLKKMNYSLESHLGLEIYTRMLLSPSFFNTCIDIGFETMHQRSVTMYQYGDGFVDYNIIDKRLTELYEEIKENQFYEIEETTFRRTMGEISCQCKGKSYDVILKALEEKFPGLSERLYELMIHAIELMVYYNNSLDNSCYGLLLEHCFKQDILMGVACQNEITMMYYIKTNYTKYHSNKSKNAADELIIDNLEAESEIIVRYKQPSIFYEISTNSIEIFEILKDYYKEVLSELHA
jgi:hypothetical protein